MPMLTDGSHVAGWNSIGSAPEMGSGPSRASHLPAYRYPFRSSPTGVRTSLSLLSVISRSNLMLVEACTVVIKSTFCATLFLLPLSFSAIQRRTKLQAEVRSMKYTHSIDSEAQPSHILTQRLPRISTWHKQWRKW